MKSKINNSWIFLFLVLISMISPSISVAINDSHEGIKSIKDEIAEQKKKYLQIHEQEKGILQKLLDMEKEIKLKEEELYKLQSKIKEKRKLIREKHISLKKMESHLNQKKELLFKRFVSFYKYAKRGYLNIFLGSSKFNEIRRLAHYLEIIFQHDMKFMNSMKETIKIKEEQILKINNEINEVKELQKKIKEQMDDINQAMNNKVMILMKIHNDKRFYETAVVELEKAADELKGQFTEVNKIAPLKHPSSDDIFKGLSGLKGKLPKPCEGDIIKLGKGLGAKIYKKGVFIKGKPNSKVMAVSSGKIVFSGWLRGYGQLIIINHGNRYFTLYAHLSKVYKKKGDIVKRGEIIGLLGDTGSIAGPGLYFEIRKGVKELNPIAWLKPN